MVNFETMSFYLLYINKCSKCAVIISTRKSSFSSIKYVFSLSLVCRAQSGDGTLWRHPATLWGLVFHMKEFMSSTRFKDSRLPSQVIYTFPHSFAQVLAIDLQMKRTFAKKLQLMSACARARAHALLAASCSSPAIYSSSLLSVTKTNSGRDGGVFKKVKGQQEQNQRVMRSSLTSP